MPTPHLVFVVNTDWFFLSHRLPIALAARDAGFRVTLLAGEAGRADEVRGHGLGFEYVPFDRGGLHPRRDLRTVGALARSFRRLRPDIVHLVTPKAVIYGAWAARLAGVRRIVAAVSGLGVAFGRPNLPLARLVEGLYRSALRRPLAGGAVRVIFQNPDDADLFVRLGIVTPERVVRIRGSGVDLARFRPMPEPPGPVRVLFASRLLAEKGADVFVEVARRMRGRTHVRFTMAGRIDPGNPTSLSERDLRRAELDGGVEVCGHVDDMAKLMAACHVVAFPTRYREGLPKVLAEAAAAGRPIVASDVPGVREVVAHGVNGLLVAPGDVDATVFALERLVDDAGMRRRMGEQGRRLAEAGLGLDGVVDAHMSLYDELLESV